MNTRRGPVTVSQQAVPQPFRLLSAQCWGPAQATSYRARCSHVRHRIPKTCTESEHSLAQGAKEDYDAAVAMDPACPDALLSRGLFRLDGGQLQVSRLPQGPVLLLPWSLIFRQDAVVARQLPISSA